MNSSFATIEARRVRLGVSKERLSAVAGITERWYRQLLAGGGQPRASTMARLTYAIRVLERTGDPAVFNCATIYWLALVAASQEAGQDPLDVLAQAPSRRATSDPAWLAASRIRQRALYIANVCCGVSQADLARVSGMTQAGVSFAINAIEDTRERDDDGTIVSVIEGVMNL